MPQLVADCPRCAAAKTTFDVVNQNLVSVEYGWRHVMETFCVCRHCHRSTVFILAQREIEPGNTEPVPPSMMKRSVNDNYEIEGYLSVKDSATIKPPEHVPANIDAAFREGATCVAAGCFNAAAAMFRLCVDHATKALLPEANVDGLTDHSRRNLAPRLKWLFQTARLHKGLEELSNCIKDDGNDGAHDGSLKKVDALDLQDFAYELLERLYTEPKRLEIAKTRREERRKPK